MRDIPIHEVSSAVQAWQPFWRVGTVSAFTHDAFYREKVFFVQASCRGVFVLLLRDGAELAAVLPMEPISEALTLVGCLAVVTPAHRGKLAPQMRNDYLVGWRGLLGWSLFTQWPL